MYANLNTEVPVLQCRNWSCISFVGLIVEAFHVQSPIVERKDKIYDVRVVMCGILRKQFSRYVSLYSHTMWRMCFLSGRIHLPCVLHFDEETTVIRHSEMCPLLPSESDE
jgi:hypothetical protein